MAIRTVAFDIIGTLFSLDKVRAELPANTLEKWFAGGLRDYFSISHSGAYTPLADVLRATLPPDADAERVMSAFRSLDPAPEAEDAIHRLGEQDTKVLALTNGSEELTRGLLERVGLDKHFAALLSCDSIQISKPHPRVYALARDLAEGELWMAASHPWDIAGAARAGLLTAWISEGRGAYPGIFPAPDIVASDLGVAAGEILAYGIGR